MNCPMCGHANGTPVCPACGEGRRRFKEPSAGRGLLWCAIFALVLLEFVGIAAIAIKRAG